MGFEITGQGVAIALAAVAVPLLLISNWSTLRGVFARRAAQVQDIIVDLRDDAAFHEAVEPHVLDVMKTLTAVNEREQLGCEPELCAMYAKIVEATTRTQVKWEKPAT